MSNRREHKLALIRARIQQLEPGQAMTIYSPTLESARQIKAELRDAVLLSRGEVQFVTLTGKPGSQEDE